MLNLFKRRKSDSLSMRRLYAACSMRLLAQDMQGAVERYSPRRDTKLSSVVAKRSGKRERSEKE